MSGYCRCGLYHEEDDDRPCQRCIRRMKKHPRWMQIAAATIAIPVIAVISLVCLIIFTLITVTVWPISVGVVLIVWSVEMFFSLTRWARSNKKGGG